MDKAGGKRGVTEKDITRTVADICGIVMHKCVHQNGKYFNHESDFTWDQKYEKVRN